MLQAGHAGQRTGGRRILAPQGRKLLERAHLVQGAQASDVLRGRGGSAVG